jgi:F-type H+-transporting ATPase subunit delta
MQAGSVRSQDELLAALDAAFDDGADAETLGRELFRVVTILDEEASLRRVLTEPSVPAKARSGIARSLLEGKVAEPTVTLLETAVSERWSRSRDMVDALERCAVIAAATRADRDGQFDALEDDLFRFGRILESSPELRDALSDRAAPAEAKVALLTSLLEGKVGPASLDLLTELLMGRARSLAAGLVHYQEVTAARRHRLVATAWVASPLSNDQRNRIARTLAAQYSHEVHLNVIVDPSVLGGVRIALGDDIIDSTIETRVAQAQRLLFR